jgi:hypothetical protein
MKSKVIGLDNKAAGDIELAEDIFGADVRRDFGTYGQLSVGETPRRYA